MKGFLQCLLVFQLAILLTAVAIADTQRNVSFDTDEGSWISVDIAPNGESLVFDLLGDIYELPMSGGIATPIITGSGFASQPRYSPDGKQLVFISDRSGEDNIWLANIDGKNLQQLTNRIDGELISPSWSVDGEFIYVSQLANRRSMTSGIELWAYPVDGRKPEKIPTPDMGHPARLVSSFAPGAYGPQQSADAKTLYFTAASPKQHMSTAGPSAAVMKVDLSSGKTSPVSYHTEPAFRPMLSRKGKWLVYGALRLGRTSLKLRNLETGDERWLLQDIGDNALESWASRDLLPNYSFTPSDEELVIAYGGKIHKVSIADGSITTIPFFANVSMAVEPRVENTQRIDEGSVIAKMAKGAVLSPDGKKFAFSAFGRLYIMGVDDQTPVQVSERTSFGEFQPAWSTDGNWLSYVTWNAHDGGGVWKISIDNINSAKKLTEDNAFYRNPVWSPNGKEIYAIRAPKNVRLENGRKQLADAEQIVRLSSEGGTASTVIATGGAISIHFTEDRNRFYTYSPQTGLASRALDGSDLKSHFRVMGAMGTANAIASDILVSPDGGYALARVAGQLYIIDMSMVPGEQAVVNVYGSDESYTRITTVGADHFSWANSTTLSWSAGANLYRKSINSDAVDEYQSVVEKPRATPSGTVVLRGARIITMQGDKVIRNGDIVIHGNRIQALGKRGKVKVPKGATTFNVRGKTIMPGIVDIHAHWQTKQSVLDIEDYNAYANLAYGVTAIRDPQSMTDDIFVYSDMVATGEMIGPRIFSTGRGVFFFNNFQTYEQVRAVLERYKKKYRTHLIKSYLPGSRQVRQWIIRACRELNMIVTAEGGSDAKMDLTFAMDGFSGTEHSIPLTPIYKDIVELYAQSGITYTPTLLVNLNSG